MKTYCDLADCLSSQNSVAEPRFGLYNSDHLHKRKGCLHIHTSFCPKGLPTLKGSFLCMGRDIHQKVEKVTEHKDVSL